MIGAIQWTSGYIVQAKMNKPIVTAGAPAIAGNQSVCISKETLLILTRRQAPFGEKLLCIVCSLSMFAFQSGIDSAPYWITHHGKHHSNEHTEKTTAALP